MLILFLPDNFPPEVDVPASRTFQHCRAWVKAGRAVTGETCAPNFLKGKVFDGYRNRLWQREVEIAIEIPVKCPAQRWVVVAAEGPDGQLGAELHVSGGELLRD